MEISSYDYPRGFLWGTATSSHQMEGNNTNNDWYIWENEPGRILNGDKAGLACDWWGGRWKEDFKRAADSGQNAHRLSIEWSRVQPKPDVWDDKALDRYAEMLRDLRRHGLTPMVTLHHFTNPIWVMERGGWEDEGIRNLFAEYTRRTVAALKDHVDLWCTINEPNVYATEGFVFAHFPPGKSNIQMAFRVMVNMARAHAVSYRVIHELQPQAKVGFALHYRGFTPEKTWFPPDTWAAGWQFSTFNAAFVNALIDGKMRFAVFNANVPEARGTQDFIGLNYYTRDLVAFNLLKPTELFGNRFYPKDTELSGTGYISNDPAGFQDALRWCAGFGLPVYVTENGVEDAEDRMRPRYTARHIAEVGRALRAGLPIQGYFHWSLLDNFEWERGWSQRFGLWGLDVETQKRIKRPSVDLYAEICRKNSLSRETVEKFTPEILEKIFPA